jgi:protoporphyrinogen oxidase
VTDRKVAIIVGGGPAGLTAAVELLDRTDFKVIVCESDPVYVGGISRTVNYKGNRIDLGGHRFFSKSDRVMKWWNRFLPVDVADAAAVDITYRKSTRALTEGLARTRGGEGDAVMHVRPRKTRIIHGGKFFAYPIELSLDTLTKLGFAKLLRVGFTYIWATLFPRRPEKTLEDFFINRFGTELYGTFFKSYTEKVWGVPCSSLSAEWGAQRVKGLSILRAVMHAAKKVANIGPLSGKSVETSLIEQFLYPTLGPGLLWEKVRDDVRARGGEVRMGTEVTELRRDGTRVVEATLQSADGEKAAVRADCVFSTTDIRHLMRMIRPEPPADVLAVSDKLEYRDFLTIGLLLERQPVEKDGTPLADTWMYVHEPELSMGRIQLFHNWHPRLVADPNHGWVGLEYFCQEGDALWTMDDQALIEFGKREFQALGFADGIAVLDGTVIRQKKAYPGYFGAYERFGTVSGWLDGMENLYLIGRNGMHRYNNQDHSMLTAMTAVDNIVNGVSSKENIWSVNTEQDYHEEKK